MLLTSPAYFTFLIVVFLAYWLVSRHRLAGVAAILAANYLFYAKWGLVYLALIPIASTIDFAIGKALAATTNPLRRRLLVGASVALNVALIVSTRLAPAHWSLALSLSFYGFQSMTYTIDIYRKVAQPARNYFAYVCSASFFPTTLAGPITRLSTLWPQIENAGRALTNEAGGRALFLIGMGGSRNSS